MHNPNASPPGPYTADLQNNGAVDQQSKTMPKNAAFTVTQKSPYAILSMFDGCGSSVDIIEAKFGYRPKVCILCEKDETLRYLVGEKHGITVDQRWQHTMEYVDVDDINVIEIGDTRDNDSRQADREQQSVIYLSDGEEEQEDPRDENQTESTARRRRTERNGAS